MKIMNIGWANKPILNSTLLFEQDSSMGSTTPPTPNMELSQNSIITPMLKFIQQKMEAYKKKAAEEGKIARLTPYRDRSVYFLQFVKDNFPELINDKLKEIETSRKGGKIDNTGQGTDVENITLKKRIPSATEINWWFGNTLRSLPNGAEVYKQVADALKSKTDDKAIRDYINVTATTRGEKYGIDPAQFIDKDQIDTALATPLSSFKSPEEKYEENIPDNRLSNEQTKEFIIKTLETFKLQNEDDPFINDSVDDIIANVEQISEPEELEDYITSQARKFNRISQVEGDGGAKQLYSILGDVIENFRHYNLMSAIKTVPDSIKIAPGSIQDVKDDVIHNIEDFIETNESKYNDSFAKVIDKIDSFKNVREIIDYLKEKSVVLQSHSEPIVRKYASMLAKSLANIQNKMQSLDSNKEEIDDLDREMKRFDSEQRKIQRENYQSESKLSNRSINNLLLEKHRKSLRKKVVEQSKYLY